MRGRPLMLALVTLAAITVHSRGAAGETAPSLPVAWKMDHAELPPGHAEPALADKILVLAQGRTLLAVSKSGVRSWRPPDTLIGVDPKTGRTLWSVPRALAKDEFDQGVTVTTTRIIVRQGRSVAAFATETGKRLWSNELPCAPSPLLDLTCSSQICAGKCEREPSAEEPPRTTLYAIGLDKGNTIWREQVGYVGALLADGMRVVHTEYVEHSESDPGDPVGHIHRASGRLRTVAVPSGATLWEVKPDEPRATLVLTKKHVVLLGGAALIGHNRESGRQAWRYQLERDDEIQFGNMASTVVSENEILIGGGILKRVSLETGKVVGTIPLRWKPDAASDDSARLHLLLGEPGRIVALVGGDPMGVGGDVHVWRGCKWVAFAYPKGLHLNQAKADRLLAGPDVDSIVALALPESCAR